MSEGAARFPRQDGLEAIIDYAGINKSQLIRQGGGAMDSRPGVEEFDGYEVLFMPRETNDFW